MESNRGSELVNYTATGIPASPGKRAVWLCLHALFKLASVLMDSWGTGSMPVGCRPGAAASAVALAGAKPSQAWLFFTLAVVHVCCTGGSCKMLRQSSRGDSLGLQSVLELSLHVKSQRLLTSFPDSVDYHLLLQDELWERTPPPSTNSEI